MADDQQQSTGGILGPIVDFLKSAGRGTKNWASDPLNLAQVIAGFNAGLPPGFGNPAFAQQQLADIAAQRGARAQQHAFTALLGPEKGAFIAAGGPPAMVLPQVKVGKGYAVKVDPITGDVTPVAGMPAAPAGAELKYPTGRAGVFAVALAKQRKGADPTPSEAWEMVPEAQRQITADDIKKHAAERVPKDTWKNVPGMPGLQVNEGGQTRIVEAPKGYESPNDVTGREIAGAIQNGTQPPDLKGLYRFAAPVRKALAESGYDLTTAQKDWMAVTKHISTLNGQQQERLRQAIAFTYDSLDVIDKLYNDWKRLAPASGFKLLNKANLAIAKQTPGELGATATALEAQINDLTSELGTVYKGGNASTDESLRLAAGNLQADYNEAQFNKAMKTIRTNLLIRRNSILNSQPAGVSANSPYLTPPAGVVPPKPTGNKRVDDVLKDTWSPQ